MKAFKTSSCCCFDLETGGLILGYLGILFFTIFFFKNPISWHFAIYVIVLSIHIGWVYGIHKNNHAFMMPEMIIAFITSVLSLIFLFLFTIGASIGLEDIAEEIEHKLSQEGIDLNVDVYASGIRFWTFLLSFTPLQLYFTSVKYSLYMKMKAAARGLDWFASGNSV